MNELEKLEAAEPTFPISQDDTTERAHEQRSSSSTRSHGHHQVGSDSTSVKGHTHSKRRKPHKKDKSLAVKKTNPIVKYTSITFGGLAIVGIVTAGVFGQFYKSKVMPNVIVADQNVGGKTETELRELLTKKQKEFSVTFTHGEKKSEPALKEIGFMYDINKTVSQAMDAKRQNGIIEKLSFWKSYTLPAEVKINSNLLSQYVESQFPDITAPPTDARLRFNVRSSTFSVTPQANGKGPNLLALKADIATSAGAMRPARVRVDAAPKGPAIPEKKLQPLVSIGNQYVQRKVSLTGAGYNFVARPVDIASWLTPTPQNDGSVKLIVDSAKVQSYVESLSKRIASPPQDKKVLVDAASGQEVTLQEGRDGTELADKQNLANTIAADIIAGKDSTQTMNIQVAAYKTVNMNAFEKWIEVDLSEQRTTAYERATPVRSFVVTTGKRGHETVKGEFSIWLRVRSQTMQGGSRADGSYYSIPNVEWVSYFYKDYAIHGAWWRDQFGVPGSRGCVNMRNEDAKWVYEWAPLGTKVIVHD